MLYNQEALSSFSTSDHEKEREQTVVKRAGLVDLQEAGTGGEKLTYTAATEVDLKADRFADNYRRLAGGWEGMQKDQPADKLLKIRQKGVRDARQQQSDNEIDCRALMGEGGFGCTRPTGLMAVI